MTIRWPAAFRSSALWAVMGDLTPMLAAVLAAPFLLEKLGSDRLGVLSLIWVVVGYFNFLDLGMSRAITVAVAATQSHSPDPHKDELGITGTALLALGALGLLGAVLIGAGVWFFFAVGWAKEALVIEAAKSALWMMPSLPLLLIASGLRGHLEGIGSFRNLNVIRIMTGILLVAGPSMSAFWAADLTLATLSIFLVRVGQVWALLTLLRHRYKLALFSLLDHLVRAAQMRRLNQLLSFGGWITVSSLVGPVIVYSDRFVLAYLVGATAVAFYAVPFDVVARFPILITSVCAVLLPELVRRASQVSIGERTPEQWMAGVTKATIGATTVIITATIAIYFSMPTLVKAWMGQVFAMQAVPIARVLLLAFAFNAAAQIPYTALLSIGQTRTIATIHVAEIVPYLAILWWAITTWGLMGAAYACLIRGGIDFVFMVVACRQKSRLLG